MKTFEFSIIASGLDPEAEDFADRFFDAAATMLQSPFKRATLSWTLRARQIQSSVIRARGFDGGLVRVPQKSPDLFLLDW
jgi:hypothetical protein